MPRSGGPRRTSFERLTVKRRIPELLDMPELLSLYHESANHGMEENTGLEGFTGVWSRDPNLRSWDLQSKRVGDEVPTCWAEVV